ncbi:MAG: PEP-CTERM sorting domain-containing protein [Bryobacterales bacterium]|nr:PEP-CTERM sorting domain-containing protein [Bryobacterales bacterium]
MHLYAKLLFIAALLVAGAGSSRAAILVTSPVPTSVSNGQSFDFTVSVTPESGEEIASFQFDVFFSPWLTPGPVTELGYFAANGVFFFAGITGPDSITFILDSLPGGDFLPGPDALVQISFTATQDGAPSISLENPVLLLTDGNEATISSIQTADVPEPSSLALVGIGAIMLWGTRRRSASSEGVLR